jgi:uncharacterized protein (DUF697 family)
MPGIKELNNVWNNVKEIDLRPIAEAAQRPLHLALAGWERPRLDALAEAMRRDPARPDQVAHTPILLATPDEAASASHLDLIILLMESVGEGNVQERQITKTWANAGVPVLVVLPQAAVESGSVPPLVDAPSDVIAGSLDDPAFLTGTFPSAVLRLLPDQQLALARQFPLFRNAVAKALISDTCFSNAAYALSTGLAEIVPIFNIPLNIADMVVLSKAQAFLVYRLGLALGLSPRWQDYVAEFGGVLGGGFLWRQVARSLIGLIPAWGILPKVAVAYAGTYVVGNVVHQWYLTGRHLSGRQMRQLYGQAFARGKNLAQSMAAKLPKPKRKQKQLASGEPGSQPEQLPPPARTAKPFRRARAKVCSNCGKTSAKDAQFCQYCGQALI